MTFIRDYIRDYAREIEKLVEMEEYMPKSWDKKAYLDHILGARNYAMILAKDYICNETILEISALLHETGADYQDNNAKERSQIAFRLLTSLRMPSYWKYKIKNCIEQHSTDSETKTIEAMLLQDADGLVYLEKTYKYYYELLLRCEKDSTKAKKENLKKLKEMRDKIQTDSGKELAKKLYRKALDYIQKCYSFSQSIEFPVF